MKDTHTLHALGDTYNLEIFMGKSKKKKIQKKILLSFINKIFTIGLCID